MQISRKDELDWHQGIADSPPIPPGSELHQQMDAATRRFEGEAGMAAFAPTATVTLPPGQEFTALSLGVYIGQTRISRVLMTPCTIDYAGQRPEKHASRQESVAADSVTVSIQYNGDTSVRADGVSLVLPPGAGRYSCSRFSHSVTYSGLSDVLMVTIPISRLLDIADALRANPAALFPDSAVNLGVFAFLGRFLFKRVVGNKAQFADEGDAESAVINVVRSALAPLLRDESPSPDPEVRRIVDAEIEVHHRDPTLTVDSLASLVGVSRRQLYRATGEGIATRLDNRRAQTAREMIEVDPNLDLSVIAELSGFVNATRLRDNFVRAYGVLPSQFRAQVRKNRRN